MVPFGDGRCSDDECPCSDVRIPRGKGYLYITEEVVTLRSRYRDEAAADVAMRIQLAAKQVMMGLGNQGLIASYTIGPILVCEQGAKRRHLDLAVAAGDAKEWWATGRVPLRATPIIETRHFAAPTTEAARLAARQAIPEGRISAMEVLHDVRKAKTSAEGATAEEAMKAARERVPPDAIDIAERRITQQGQNGIVEVDAPGEVEARRAWGSHAPDKAVLTKCECVAAPKRGLLGIGRRDGKWKVHWMLAFKAQIAYKEPAVIEVTLNAAS